MNQEQIQKHIQAATDHVKAQAFDAIQEANNKATMAQDQLNGFARSIVTKLKLEGEVNDKTILDEIDRLQKNQKATKTKRTSAGTK